MAVSSLKWILLLLLLITYISNTYGRGGRGGGGRGGGGHGGGGYGRSSGSRGGSYGGSYNPGYSGTAYYKSRYHGSGSKNNNRRYYGSGSSNNVEDKADPAYTTELFRFRTPTPEKVTKPPYNPFDDPRYKDYKFEVPKLQAPGSGFSRRREPEEDKIYNDIWAKVPDYRIDDKTIKAQDFIKSPPKEWWRAEQIPRYKRSSD